jgi:Ca-activated chloride channel family protein
MSFSDPRWLQALIGLPVLALLAWLAARRAGRRLTQLVGERKEHALLAQLQARDRAIGAALQLGALAALVVGAAGPEWGREVVRRGSTGSDVVLVADVSASMDARDVPPSRMDEARREALAVLDHLAGSRVAVVAFAGDAVRLLPLTLDRAAARLVVEALSTGTVSEPGTDLGKALRMALKVMPPGRREEQAIVVWTDGEDLENGARAAMETVAQTGIRVFAVGVGTPAGDVVPVLDSEGRTSDVKRDEAGNIVRSRLDEGLLRALAHQTHGAFFPAQRPGGELPRLLAAVGGLARAGRSVRLVERPVARFPWWAGLAALLLAADLARPRSRRTRRSAADTPLTTGKGMAVAAALLVVLAPAPARGQSAWARGDRAFKAGRFAEAESLYARRLARGGPEAVRVNRATARALAGRRAEAEAELAPLAVRSGRAGNAAGYNLGTLQGEDRDYDRALQSLRMVLERDPADADARWNYEVLLRRREEERRSQSQPKQPQPAPSSGGGGVPQPAPAQQSPSGGSPSQAGQPPPSDLPRGGPSSMTRQQADQLLNALQELSRAEQQRRRNVRAVAEKRGKDW